MVIPPLDRPAMNASSVSSAAAGAAEASAAVDRTIAQTVGHFREPTFIGLGASVLCADQSAFSQGRRESTIVESPVLLSDAGTSLRGQADGNGNG
jgi:hypothetical protein